MSTTGLCPDTVIVSSTPPTLSSALIVAVKLAGRSTPSRFTVPKPGQRERDAVAPRRQADDLVLALSVGDHGPHPSR